VSAESSKPSSSNFRCPVWVRPPRIQTEALLGALASITMLTVCVKHSRGMGTRRSSTSPEGLTELHLRVSHFAHYRTALQRACGRQHPFLSLLVWLDSSSAVQVGHAGEWGLQEVPVAFTQPFGCVKHWHLLHSNWRSSKLLTKNSGQARSCARAAESRAAGFDHWRGYLRPVGKRLISCADSDCTAL